VFWGRGRDLITTDTPVRKVAQFSGSILEYGWLADTCRVLYARLHRALSRPSPVVSPR
jgi:hypothetical protein